MESPASKISTLSEELRQNEIICEVQHTCSIVFYPNPSPPSEGSDLQLPKQVIGLEFFSNIHGPSRYGRGEQAVTGRKGE